MEASQPAYRAGALCRDLTLFLVPIQYLISVHMSKWTCFKSRSEASLMSERAGLLGEISLEWRTGEISAQGGGLGSR